MDEWIDIDTLKVWGEGTDTQNYNQGDVGAIYTSILKFGFNQTPRVWKNGEVRAGNHSLLALRMVRDNGKPPPKNVRVIDGKWCVRWIDVSHLSDAQSIAYAIADNRLSALASQDEDLLIQYLKASESEELLEATGYDSEDIARMLAANTVPDFQPVGIDEQPRLDQKKPITCPHCGKEFVPNG